MDTSTENWPLLQAIPRPADAKSEADLSGRPVPAAGVYMLWGAAGDLVYVGQSADISRRLTEHRKEGIKPFVRATWFEVTCASDRLRIETILICCALPPQNRHATVGIAGGTQPGDARWAYDYRLRFPARRPARAGAQKAPRAPRKAPKA